MRLSIGIDPGAKGAVALYDGKTLQVFDMPTVEVKRGTRTVRQTDAGLLKVGLVGCMVGAGVQYFECAATVERVGAMPGQGVSSMFAFGRAAGVIEGVLAGLGIKTTLVSPQVWQAAMGVKGKGKDGARYKAAQIHPRDAGLFVRKKDDGRADAVLMATYAWHKTPRGALWMSAMGGADAAAEKVLEGRDVLNVPVWHGKSPVKTA